MHSSIDPITPEPKSMSADTARRGPGRPRDAEVDTRILRAALSVLSAEGYTGMSMDAVASLARVSKPTIYRRWSTKMDLATASIATMVTDDPPNEEMGVWDALLFELHLFDAALKRGHGISVMGTVLALEEQEPELLARFRESVVKARRDRIRAVLRAGVISEELNGELDIELVLNMLLGYYYASYIGGESQREDWPDQCLRLLRRGIER